MSVRVQTRGVGSRAALGRSLTLSPRSSTGPGGFFCAWRARGCAHAAARTPVWVWRRSPPLHWLLEAPRGQKCGTRTASPVPTSSPWWPGLGARSHPANARHLRLPPHRATRGSPAPRACLGPRRRGVLLPPHFRLPARDGGARGVWGAEPHRRVLKHMNYDSQDQHGLPVKWCCETITTIFRRALCWSKAMIPAVLSSYKRYPW